MAPTPSPAEFRALEREHDDEVVGSDTIPEMFFDSVGRNAERRAQRYKGGVYPRSLTPAVVPEPAPGEFASISYERMGDLVGSLARGFRELGVDAGDRVGLFADTRMEWALCDFGLLAAGGVVTTVYADSSPKQATYLLADPGAIGVVCENERLLDRIDEARDDLGLEFVVVMDELREYADADWVYSLADVSDLGEDARAKGAGQVRSWLDARAGHDLASLVYTSGTTGQPKGVKLTHHNFRANVNQLWKRVGPRPDRGDGVPTMDPGDTTISFLPLAHVFERTTGHFLIFAAGGTVGYAESPDTVGEDIRALRPNVGSSVPRVYERIYGQMRTEAGGSALGGRVFGWAVEVARKHATTDYPGLGLRVRHRIADRLVYSRVREQLGGNIDFLVSGGGSLSTDLADLFGGMGVPIHEGYGLTEAAPVVTTNPPEDPRTGTLGPPLPGVQYRIDETAVAEGQFGSVDGAVGELLIRGPNVTTGYWEMPEETAAAFTDDGFLRTGDIVERAADDYLVYHDRLKNLLVLDTGENVAPEHVEDQFATASLVDQVMAIGDEEKFVSALIVPNLDAVARLAANRGVALPETNAARCRDERVREWVGEEIRRANRNLERHETVKRFELVPTEWTPENDTLTPSLKKKRRNIMAACTEAVARIYDESERVAAD